MKEPFEPLRISGFCNQGVPSPTSCDKLRFNGTLGVQQSFYLDEDMVEVAKALDSHPLIKDKDKKEHDDPGYREWVAKKWAHLAGSSVWLPDQEVYLAINRVIYYPSKVLHWPTISFLHGRIFDEHWNEIQNYTIRWDGDEIVFPRSFDIPIPYKEGDIFFGPEDPRIILESDVPGAEPVIIFNMRIELDGWPRAMWTHRPFSNATTIMTIRGQDERAQAEKNWTPFFHRPQTDKKSQTASPRMPSQHLHFIHKQKPFRVIRCSLATGYCDDVFRPEIPEDATWQPWPNGSPINGRVHGGTNFLPVTIPHRPDLQVYAGFPRTKLAGSCDDTWTYRPELVVIASTGGDNFHIVYASGPIDFDTAVLDEEARANPCDAGHILIANSVSRWDLRDGRDTMTLSLSVADRTVQILHLHGVREFIMQLPYFNLGPLREQENRRLNWSIAGNDVLTCMLEDAMRVQGRSSLEFLGGA